MTSKQKKEYTIIVNCLSTLAELCAANEEVILSTLTGYLWDEEEEGQIAEVLQSRKK